MKLFIGGISQHTTEDHLRSYFESYGPVSSCFVVYDKKLNSSKGYAFVECVLKRTAERILEVNKHEILGRVVEVTQAVGKLGKTATQRISKNNKRLFVGGLPQKATKEHLFNYFSSFGEVVNAYIIYDPKSGISKNFGYVEFMDNSVAETVLQQPYHEIMRKNVTVEFNKGSKKPNVENPSAVYVGNQVLTQDNHQNYDMEHIIDKCFTSAHKTHQEPANLQLPDSMPKGIIPASMFWNDQNRDDLADCEAANLQSTCIDSTTNYIAAIHAHSTNYRLSTMLSYNKIYGHNHQASDRQVSNIVKYDGYYRHLKASDFQRCQHFSNYENYKLRKEPISTGIRRIAKLQASVDLLRF